MRGPKSLRSSHKTVQPTGSLEVSASDRGRFGGLEGGLLVSFLFVFFTCGLQAVSDGILCFFSLLTHSLGTLCGLFALSFLGKFSLCLGDLVATESLSFLKTKKRPSPFWVLRPFSFLTQKRVSLFGFSLFFSRKIGKPVPPKKS